MKKFLVLLLLLPFLLAAAPSRTTKMEEMRTRIDQLEQKTGMLESELAALRNEMTALRQVVRISPGGIQIRSDQGLQIQALGPLDLRGTVIRLNGGNRPAAVVGSKISAPPLTGTGEVVEGSPTILLK